MSLGRCGGARCRDCGGVAPGAKVSMITMRPPQAGRLGSWSPEYLGVLAKLRAFYHDEEIAQMRAGDDPDDGLPEEWTASIYRDLERLAGEARS